jgi:hypothetical protein
MKAEIIVSWFAKKYGKTIFRKGVVDNKYKVWIDKKGNQCVCFYDTMRDRYTTGFITLHYLILMMN